MHFVKRIIAIFALVLPAVGLLAWLSPPGSESANTNLNPTMAGNWTLENVEEAARQSTGSFFIPSKAERENQKAGDSVRLHFVLRNPKDGEPRAERMWVTVTHPYGTSGPYRGVLENQPAFITGLHRGDEVEFLPSHIARTILKKGDPRWIDAADKRALVSELCFAKGECVRFLYREEPDHGEDSGWRMFSGKESDEFANDPKNIRSVELGWMFDRDPSLLTPLKAEHGAVFERDDASADWRKVEDWEPED